MNIHFAMRNIYSLFILVLFSSIAFNSLKGQAKKYHNIRVLYDCAWSFDYSSGDGTIYVNAGGGGGSDDPDDNEATDMGNGFSVQYIFSFSDVECHGRAGLGILGMFDCITGKDYSFYSISAGGEVDIWYVRIPLAAGYAHFSDGIAIKSNPNSQIRIYDNEDHPLSGFTAHSGLGIDVPVLKNMDVNVDSGLHFYGSDWTRMTIRFGLTYRI